MRREQYTLRDSYRKIIPSTGDTPSDVEDELTFDVDIEVLPLGLKQEEMPSSLIFRAWRELDPNAISQPDLMLISYLYWKK